MTFRASDIMSSKAFLYRWVHNMLDTRHAVRLASVAMTALLSTGLAACHGLLDVSDPTVIQDKDAASAAGANSRRLNVVLTFTQKMNFVTHEAALFSDERTYNPLTAQLSGLPAYGSYAYDLDRHDDIALTQYAALVSQDKHLAALDEIFSKSSLAVAAMRAYGTSGLKGEYLAQLFSIRAYVVLQMAEDICPGFPINDISTDNVAVYSGPYSYTDAVTYALAQADSALANGRDSARFVNFARVVKGRALLDLGRYADADTVVAPVLTAYAYQTDATGGFAANYFFLQYDPNEGYYTPVGDRKGGNGLSFVSAHDPRVLTAFLDFDPVYTTDSMFAQEKYPDYTVPITVASGIEARLIQAEAALHEPNPARAFAILDTLRSTVGLGALTVPSTLDAQADTLYKERAFWLYLTGRRLGDMRRLIRNYGRSEETVFPTGSHRFGDSYGTGTAIPFTLQVQSKYNPHITAGCTTP